MIRHWPWPNLKSATIWEDFHVLFRTVSPVSTPTGDELKEAFNNQVMCLGNVFDDCKNTGNFYHFSVYCLIFSMVTEVQFLKQLFLSKNCTSVSRERQFRDLTFASGTKKFWRISCFSLNFPTTIFGIENLFATIKFITRQLRYNLVILSHWKYASQYEMWSRTNPIHDII